MRRVVSQIIKGITMSKVNEQWQFVQDVARLIEYAGLKGIKLTFGEAYRTKEQQAIHLKNKKTTVKHSRHQDRLAIDFNFFINGKLTYKKKDIQALGDFWEKLNKKNRWGGNWKNFKDVPHFERKT